jgi:hypothetical protein
MLLMLQDLMPCFGADKTAKVHVDCTYLIALLPSLATGLVLGHPDKQNSDAAGQTGC